MMLSFMIVGLSFLEVTSEEMMDFHFMQSVYGRSTRHRRASLPRYSVG